MQFKESPCISFDNSHSQTYPLMDIAFFQLDEGDRHSLLQAVMHSFGCTYICLWSYLPQPSNRLRFLDGFFHEENTQPSSSSGSLAQLLFGEYRQLEFSVEDGLVPGLAHKNNVACLKLEESELQAYASADVQRQFYAAARIQTSMFLGSINGEIELGFSNVSQVSLPMIISNLVSGDIAPQVPRELPQPATVPNPPSSSSSSLRSLSMDSPESSSLLFNVIQSTSHVAEAFTDFPILQPVSATIPHQHSMNAIFAQTRNLQFPTPEAENEAMTRAILAVLSSPACSSSSIHQPLGGIPPSYHLNVKASAFKKYARVLSPSAKIKAKLSRQSMMKRSIAFLRNLNLMRFQERVQTSRPTSSQLHHVISERRRREKLNDSFQALKSLLPPGTKKDKGSVLTTTREYLSSLKAQIAELSRKNQLLEAQLLPAAQAAKGETSIPPDERFSIQVLRVPESTSEGQIIDLQIAIRGESPLTNMVIGILEFLKQLNNVNVVSMEANTRLTVSSSINHLTLRLIIEDNERDDSAFQEAVRRIVSDLAQ